MVLQAMEGRKQTQIDFRKDVKAHLARWKTLKYRYRHDEDFVRK